LAKLHIFAIDPGPEHSAYVEYDGDVLYHGILDNHDMLPLIYEVCMSDNACQFAIEMIASYGMSVGASVFNTCVWIGRFIEVWDREQPGSSKTHAGLYVYRKDVKMHLCGNTKAKDSNIRQAIMDRYGSEKSKAIGTQKQPGPLYGIRKDEWAALAVAITAFDRRHHETN
jgi:hypothetical protein